jgi:hypothetical protein
VIRGSCCLLLRTVCAILVTRQHLIFFLAPDMLRFPVSLLTATALIEGITRVVSRQPTLLKSRACAECFNRTCDCHLKNAAPYEALSLEDIPTDTELRILRTSGVLKDIRAVLGLSEV